MRYPDTNQIIKGLEGVKFTHEQGEELIKVMHQINDVYYHGLASSFEVQLLKSDLTNEITRLEQKISDFKFDMLVWLIVSQVSATSIILGALQLAGRLF